MAVYTIEDTTLTGIANAIREKTGGTEAIRPVEMANVINEMNIIPPGKKVLTGNISNAFRGEVLNWFWEDGSVSTNNLTGAVSCFSDQSNIKNIPIIFNFQENVKATISNMFYGCKQLEELPQINNLKPAAIDGLFENCQHLGAIPEDYMDTWNMEEVQTNGGSIAMMFWGCYRLRTIPTKILSKLWGPQSTYQSLFSGGFYNCYSLDEIIGVEPGTGTLTSNAFSLGLGGNYHLKDFIFATNEDGSAKIAKWKAQTIDLSSYIGYGPLSSYGFTKDTYILDDKSYQLLKDNPDAWAPLLKYSRYNHDSAVRTINSLPDTSAYLATAGGTNTIKFESKSGSATDGGAIGNLTEEEIAVAAAKGWTVSLV